MSQDSEIEDLFNTMAGWLKDTLFHVENDYLKRNPSQAVKYEISTFMKRGYNYPFNISYSPVYKDMLLFNSRIGMEENDYQSLMIMQKGERTQILMDIRKYLFPLNVSVEVTLPKFFVYKLVGMEAIRNSKNYFIEQSVNFRNAMELLKIRLDEEFFIKNPDGVKHDDDYYK